jgi:glycosyltransferase involved in cell wall biosynthesis
MKYLYRLSSKIKTAQAFHKTMELLGSNITPNHADFRLMSRRALEGANLLAIGIIGEYIGKIFIEVKHRPRYIIQEFINKEK